MPPNMPFSKYVQQVRLLEKVYNELKIENLYLDDVLEKMQKSGLQLEEIITSDVATVTLPILFSPRRKPSYTLMTKEAKEFVEKHKPRFKKILGVEGEEILKCLAFKRFETE